MGYPDLTQAQGLNCNFFPISDKEKHTLTVASCRQVASIPIAAIPSTWKGKDRVIRAGGRSSLYLPLPASQFDPRGPHSPGSKHGPLGTVQDKGPHQRSCSLHGWRHQILSLSLSHGCSLLFLALEGLGAGALHCAWGLPYQSQDYGAGQERTDKLHLPQPKVTREFMPKSELLRATSYLSSKFRSTSDRHGRSLLFIGFEGKRGIGEQFF